MYRPDCTDRTAWIVVTTCTAWTVIPVLPGLQQPVLPVPQASSREQQRARAAAEADADSARASADAAQSLLARTRAALDKVKSVGARACCGRVWGQRSVGRRLRKVKPGNTLLLALHALHIRSLGTRDLGQRC